MSMYNAITFDKYILKRVGAKACTRINYVGSEKITAQNVHNYLLIDENFDGDISGDIYLSDLMLNDGIIDKVIEHRLTTDTELMISASNSLYEVGACDKKYGVTPIGYAHKLGLLDGAYIVGGVYLDKDDIALINQSGAKIILTPSDTMWHGNGIPPLRMMLNLGADIYIGTGSGEKNHDADINFEKNLLQICVSGALCQAKAIDDDTMRKILKVR